MRNFALPPYSIFGRALRKLTAIVLAGGLLASAAHAAGIALANPIALAIESGGVTGLVTDGERLVRVELGAFAVLETLASGLSGAKGVAIESGGASALVANGGANSLVRVNLASGALSTVSTALFAPYGVALEAGGASALVTDCGATSCQSSGRLVRVDLASGVVTSITPTSLGLNHPRGVAIEAGGASALVSELWGPRLLRVDLASGGVTALSSGFTDFGAYPVAVAIESGGATAVVSDSCRGLDRVNLATGTITHVATIPAPGYCIEVVGVALEAGGTTALVVDNSQRKLFRVNIASPDQTIGPSRQSVEGLFTPRGVAVEAGGGTALVTDCGATSCESSGRLVRVDLASGVVTPITPVSLGLNNPRGVAIEAGGTSALVSELWGRRLLRVDLASGGVTALSSGFTDFGAYPAAVAIESGGATAVVSDSCRGLDRVNLATGAITHIATIPAPGYCIEVVGVAIEAGGATALAVDGSQGKLFRVNLSSGAVTMVAAGLASPIGIAIEAGGATALITENAHSGRLLRVDLASGSFTVLDATLGSPKSFSIEAGGTSALVAEGNRLIRVSLTGTVTPKTLAQALELPKGVALEAGGATALFLDCGASPNPNCSTSARLRRLDLATGAVTQIASGLNNPSALAIRTGTSTLITDCGAAGTSSCSSTGPSSSLSFQVM